MRPLISRGVSLATAIAWLLVLLLLFAIGQRFTFGDVIALINDAAVFAMLCVVVAALYFAYRPRRWLAVALLIISLLPACLFPYLVWQHMSFFRTFGGHYLDALWLTRQERFDFFGAVIFVSLAFLWAAICWRLREIVTTT